MKFATAINNVSSGELSPKLVGRLDLKEYQQGALKLQNFYPSRSGGATKRVGTRYLSLVADYFTDADRNKIPLYSFIFSRTETYTFSIRWSSVYSELILEVFNLSGTRLEAIRLTTILTDTIWGNIGTINLNGFRLAQSADKIFIVHNEGKIEPFVLARLESDSFEVTQLVQEDWIGNLKVGLSVPYLENNVKDIFFKPSATGVYGTALTVTSYSDSGGTTVTPFFTPEHVGAYFKIDNTGLTATGIFKITTISGTAALFASGTIVAATDIITTGSAHGYTTGDKVKLKLLTGTIPVGLTADATYYVIYSAANALLLATTLTLALAGTQVDITDVGAGNYQFEVLGVSIATGTVIAGAFTAAQVSKFWNEAAWSNYQGWPTAITFWKQRLIMGGATQNGDTVYNSLVGTYYHFMQNKLIQDAASEVSGLGYFGALAVNDAFALTLNSTTVNRISWFVADKTLQVGTIGAEWTVETKDGVYGPTNFSALPQGNVGGKGMAIKVGKSAIFVSNDGKRLMESSYSDEQGTYVSRDLTVLSDQIRLRGADTTGNYSDIIFNKIVWQGSRGILWILLSNNKLVAITIETSTETIGWSHHIISGTDASITGIAIIPNAVGDYDDVWLAVKRTIDGATVCYLEKMGADFEHSLLDNSSTDDNDVPWYSDSSVHITNTPASTTVAGLDHLEGETVDILADGEVITAKVVDSGEIELDVAAESIIVGLNYVALFKSMPIEAGSQIGNSQISLTRIDKILLKVFNSLFGQYGSSEGNLYDLEYENVTVPTGGVYTGNLETEFDATPDEEQYVVVKHDKPTPFSLIAVFMRGMTGD